MERRDSGASVVIISFWDGRETSPYLHHWLVFKYIKQELHQSSPCINWRFRSFPAKKLSSLIGRFTWCLFVLRKEKNDLCLEYKNRYISWQCAKYFLGRAGELNYTSHVNHLFTVCLFLDMECWLKVQYPYSGIKLSIWVSVFKYWMRMIMEIMIIEKMYITLEDIYYARKT